MVNQQAPDPGESAARLLSPTEMRKLGRRLWQKEQTRRLSQPLAGAIFMAASRMETLGRNSMHRLPFAEWSPKAAKLVRDFGLSGALGEAAERVEQAWRPVWHSYLALRAENPDLVEPITAEMTRTMATLDAASSALGGAAAYYAHFEGPRRPGSQQTQRDFPRIIGRPQVWDI